MSGWQDVNLKDVTTSFDPLPAGEYIFNLLPGAHFTEKGELQGMLAVAEGDHTGRTAFIRYPNPAEFDWVLKALKVLEIALGVDQVPGEDMAVYLNRAVNEGGGKLRGKIAQREYLNKAGEKVIANDVKLFTFRPAA